MRKKNLSINFRRYLMRKWKMHLNVKSKKYRNNDEYLDILKQVVKQIEQLPPKESESKDDL